MSFVVVKKYADCTCYNLFSGVKLSIRVSFYYCLNEIPGVSKKGYKVNQA